MKMNVIYMIIFSVSLIIIYSINLPAQSQSNRIRYNNQNLFLSGVNLAWMSFANDIGPAPNNYTAFEEFFLAIHDSGGNAVRWWLHTNGTNTPEFDANGYVVGPARGTIDDLKKVLDIAWEREVGVILCLWSFDMLRSNLNQEILNRNTLLLTDTNYTRAYINNCLIPIVNSLKGHPAIIAWEIFNEPEGMSTEFGWSETNHVPMFVIQRFVNLCAGAIHRTDTAALVTNGSASIKTLTDITPAASIRKVGIEEQYAIAKLVKERYNFKTSVEDIQMHLQYLATLANYNYYSDERLQEAGGDSDGYLDFYSFHYYGADLASSPFANQASTWNSTKQLVVAEFHITATNGIPKENLYPTLYANGYAGALAWSWTDNQVTQKIDIIEALGNMWRLYKENIDVLGISGAWPSVTLIKPVDNASFSSGATITLEATAYDSDGYIVMVEFYYADTVKIGVDSVAPYSLDWSGMGNGYYTVSAVAIDDHGNKRRSDRAKIQVGTPPMVRYEAEQATRNGSGMSIKSDPNASNGAFVDVATNNAGTTITWTFTNVLGAGNYQITFGYNLFYDTPKGQFINVNGSRAGELMFDGQIKTWLEKSMCVDLIAGINTVQMEMSWGWMYVDYLAVPREVVTNFVAAEYIPRQYNLHQNYPNPFNSETKITYELPEQTQVKLIVYDILGRKVDMLVNEEKPAGIYQTTWNAYGMASGVYFYKLEGGSYSETKKMILLR